MSKLSLSAVVFLLLQQGFILVTSFPTDIPILRPAAAAPLNTDEIVGTTTEDTEAIVVEAATTIDGILVVENNENGSSSNGSVVKEFDPNDCFLMKERGPCRAAIDSWFFNVGTKSCENFNWSGCGGNKNRFPDQSTCETHCSPPFSPSSSTTVEPNEMETSSSPSPTSTSTSSSDGVLSNATTIASTTTAEAAATTTTASPKPKLPVCPKFDGCPSKCVIIQDRSDRGCKKCHCGSSSSTSTSSDESKQQLPPNIQVSTGNITVGSESSEPAPVGSVSGDPSVSAEEEVVVPPVIGTPAEVCLLPAKRGHCRAMETRYRYDTKVKDCVPFHYGGCDANPNNFVSKDKCVEYCKGQ